jgi:hypothetical protein
MYQFPSRQTLAAKGRFIDLFFHGEGWQPICSNAGMRLSLILISSFICCGQSLSIGVKGGFRATDDIADAATSESKRYIAGPMVELGLPLGLGVEFNALYRREGYRSSFGNFAGSIFSRERGNSWEFPILVKYKLPIPIARPFVEVGYAPRVINGSVDSNGVTVNLLTGAQTFQRSHMNTNWDSSQGIVAGGGIQLGLGRLLVSPEVRYTHWNNSAIHVYYSNGVAFQSTQDQVDLLVGIGWNTRLLGRR